MLLNALKDAGLESAYFPVDASQPMLEIACAAAEDDDIETVGIKADISSPMHLIYAADAAEPTFANLRGAGLFAGISLGKVSLDDVRAIVKADQVFEPDAAARSTYRPMYREYRGLYGKLHGVYARLNRRSR